MLLTGATLATLAVAVAVFLLLVDQMHQHSRWAARYPPGPMPLPGLGNLLQVNFQDPLLSFSQLRRRFGDVFSLQQVWTPVVVLNGLAAVREALVYRSQDTSDRPSATVYEHLGYGPRSEGRPFSPNALLNKAVSNVIASLTFGSRFEYNDLRILKLLDILEDGLKEEVGFVRQVLEAIPVLLRIPGLAAKVFPAQRAFMALIDELVTEHRMTRDRAQPPRDLTDAFLDEVEKAKGNPESSFNDENLRLVVSDLFSAGMITTSTTLAWALLLMILHPDVQRRVQQEIDEVIGQGCRHPPVQTPPVPDISCQGTTLITNLSSVLKDETIWKKPFHFHPEHFLDAQGRFVKQEAFIPFSAGRRSCLGEPLARMELFLFFTSLLQHFSFSVPAGQPRPSSHGVFAFLVTPSPYQLCALPR
ncbi:cytochrome P450 2D14 isoform X8 [Eubalaena glacialis]|uniref:cytochrome P450 2D14 isoform X8 n=1 Tax=Eubalaena glacialis TaxID=27606 RepID=UPI002A5A3DBD|nr:cytochrome P450 2D14 isoform X8 [Eubalaena glacialis]